MADADISRWYQLFPGNLAELCEDLPDNFFYNGIQLRNTIAGLPIAVTRMPDLIKAAIPGPDFFHRMPIGMTGILLAIGFLVLVVMALNCLTHRK